MDGWIGCGIVINGMIDMMVYRGWWIHRDKVE